MVHHVRLRRAFLIWALALLPVLDLPGGSAGQPAPYTVGTRDVLLITVWDEPDLTGKFVIEADGTLNFPLIGRIKAAGLALPALEAELKRLLADGYLKDPRVSVAVDQYHSQRIFVIGEVRSPGTYPLTGGMTLIEAVASAGATLPSAAGEILVVRPPSGRQASGPILPNQVEQSEVMSVDLAALQRGIVSSNVALQDGDTVFVPRAEMVYVYGQVRSPGAYAVEKGATVLQALSLAGGVTERGSTGRIRIMRVLDGKKKELRVKLTDLVEPGDTIVVPQRFF
jgi:polysaccharide biosynthesis/export protein